MFGWGGWLFRLHHQPVAYRGTCLITYEQIGFPPIYNRGKPSSSFIGRLNSGNFRIFEPCEWNLNLNSSDCRASKIIYNDIKLEPISWELNLKNPVLNTCVGVSVGGHPRANFSHTAKDAQNNSTSVDPNLMTVGYIGLKITGVKIAWVDVKSNKYP